MLDIEKTVALVPARGGSQGIPGKNIRPLAERPLLYWVLDALRQSDAVAATYVSTDSLEIRACVDAYDRQGVRCVGRAPDTATNTASTESVMLDFAKRVDFDRIILVQATSPLLETEHIEAGLKLMDEGYDSVLSVVRQHRFIWKEGERGAEATNYDPSRRPRRQDWDGIFVENGAFYITSRKSLLASSCRLSGRVGMIEMPERTYVELDTETDWEIVENLMRSTRL